MATVTAKVLSNKLRICIDGLLHLSIDISELVGIQAFTWSDDRWHIDFITKTNTIECWYTNKQLWEDILKSIDGIDLV